MVLASFADVLNGEFWVIAFALIAILAFVLIGGFIAYIAPVIVRLNSGELGGEKECCPPGLGCNDPMAEYRACRRIRAQQLATPMEFSKLDELWVAFKSTSRHRRKEKYERQLAYSEFRDGIIARALEAAQSNGGNLHVPLLEAKEGIAKSEAARPRRMN